MAWSPASTDLLAAVQAASAASGLVDAADVTLGAPKSFEARVSGYTAFLPNVLEEEGGATAVANFQPILAAWAYAVEDAPDDAELALAGWVDTFTDRVIALRAGGGSPWRYLTGMPESTRANRPEYLDWNGQEVRHHGIVLTFRLQRTTP